MIKVLPELYQRTGFLIDIPPRMNWMEEEESYSLDCLATELKVGSINNIFDKIIEILVAGRVNIDYFSPLIGEFDSIGESIIYCHTPFIKNLTQSIIYFRHIEKENYKLAKSFHFHFNQRVLVNKQIENLPLVQDNFTAYPNLKINISYPVFYEDDIAYTNQLLVIYN